MLKPIPVAFLRLLCRAVLLYGCENWTELDRTETAGERNLQRCWNIRSTKEKMDRPTPVKTAHVRVVYILQLLLIDCIGSETFESFKQNFSSSPCLCFKHLASDDEVNVKYQAFAPLSSVVSVQGTSRR